MSRETSPVSQRPLFISLFEDTTNNRKVIDFTTIGDIHTCQKNFDSEVIAKEVKQRFKKRFTEDAKANHDFNKFSGEVLFAVVSNDRTNSPAVAKKLRDSLKTHKFSPHNKMFKKRNRSDFKGNNKSQRRLKKELVKMARKDEVTLFGVYQPIN